MGRNKKKETFFHNGWLSDPEFSIWLKKGKTETFQCKVCPGTEKTREKSLGDMSVGALRKHAGGGRHEKCVEQYQSTLSFFQPNKEQQQPVATSSNASTPNSEDGPDPEVVEVDGSNNRNLSNENHSVPNPIPSIFSVYSSAKAEIIWALNCVQHGYSDNSAKDFGDTLRAMCPSSPEAQNFKMASTKLMYVVNYGLYIDVR